MQLFFETAWNTTVELAPWLLLGALVAGLLHVLLPRDFVQRHLSGRGSVAKAVAIGVPLPLCSCSVIPLAISLREERASRGATVGFLISTPQTGVDSVLVSAGMLGWPFALFKVAAALVTGLVGGWVTEAWEPKSNESGIEQLPLANDRTRRSWRELPEHSLEILHSVWRWLVVGILLSAAITTLVPGSVWTSVAGYGTLVAMLLVLAVSVPMYVCATASVPIAAALVASGLPAGAAMVFLMAGPAVNIATIGAVRKTLGNRAMVVYLATIIVGSMAAGLLFSDLLQLSAHAGHAHDHTHHHPITWWSIASAVTMLLLFAWFAVTDLQRLVRRNQVGEAHAGEQTLTIPVAGMNCQGCVSKAESALARTPSIRIARVTLDPPQAVVVGSVSMDEVRAVVEGAGFRVSGE
ncbi:permease [Aeoliella sp. SH292]|uniref:permease n=1 Tax=Aeoliella sp. SH292 TaxID=3454464 RepID=UPI003F9D8DF7